MNRQTLTGTRIRERRNIAGLKQADLARQVGISASYLNLIEHNRRRIGGKLLLDIASALKVEPQAIIEGAEAALIATLREAGEAAALEASEAARAEEFAGRFPGWASALSKAHRRISVLERTVESLGDRMAHDPQLAASLHEVLSTAAAIRATASILAETPELEPPQRDRFHANMHQDSQRLSESAKVLVDFLEADPDSADAISAQEEVEAWLASESYAFPKLAKGEARPEDILQTSGLGPAARHLAGRVLDQLVKDTRRVPLAQLRRALADIGFDVPELVRHFKAPVPVILRGLAWLPEEELGLVIADRAGSLIFRKSSEGFDAPRFDAACPLWPIFDALAQPGVIMRNFVLQKGKTLAAVEVISYAAQKPPATYNTGPLVEALMLVRPVPRDSSAPDEVQEIGVTCRICSREGCPARREPSILLEGV